jgi:hypothetical protein
MVHLWGLLVHSGLVYAALKGLCHIIHWKRPYMNENWVTKGGKATYLLPDLTDPHAQMKSQGISDTQLI